MKPKKQVKKKKDKDRTIVTLQIKEKSWHMDIANVLPQNKESIKLIIDLLKDCVIKDLKEDLKKFK